MDLYRAVNREQRPANLGGINRTLPANSSERLSPGSFFRFAPDDS
jgi:hypothetical protein